MDLAGHLYHWCTVNAPTEVANVQNDSEYRENLARDELFQATSRDDNCS
jgi:hypothetical protein